VEYCLYTLDHAGGLVSRHIEAYGQIVKDRPSDIFKNHVWVSPYPEDDIPRLVDVIGADRIVAGSDWPHLEGTPTPLDFAATLNKLDTASVRKIMRDNGLELLR
jgi:predicted TIM-barrel fold metal-dependent hydrolase